MIEDDVDSRIKAFHKARRTNDLNCCLECFEKDTVFTLVDAGQRGATLNIPGGNEDIRSVVSEFLRLWCWEDVTYQRAVTNGNEAFVWYTLSAIYRPSNTPVTTEIVDYIKFNEEGKAVEFTEFVNTAAIEA
ncbi:MAG: nuclear transport factor 2 family protein [Pseudomonadota bacterium]